VTTQQRGVDARKPQIEEENQMLAGGDASNAG
jgi:hypothetical protein